MLDLGGVVGYIDQIQRKIWGEVGRHIAGMNFQTRSNTTANFMIAMPLFIWYNKEKGVIL